MRHQLWIIEARDESGQLIFDCPQPNTFFGLDSIHGMTEDGMAKTIFRKIPDATLDGGSIAMWPKLINPHWIARKKTW
jgi:hypothetical protein